MEKHIRSYTGIQLRQGEEAGTTKLSGSVPLYDDQVLSEGYEGEERIIERFSKDDTEIIIDSNFQVLFAHKPENILGKVGINVEAEVKGDTFVFTLHPPTEPTECFKEVQRLLASGLISDLSLGFMPTIMDIDTSNNNQEITWRGGITLLEVSLVGNPAWQGTKISNQIRQTIDKNTLLLQNSKRIKRAAPNFIFT